MKFIIKKRNGEIISELEIKNSNKKEINEYIEGENIKIKDNLIELKLKSEIDDLNKKYQNLQNELNLLKEKYLFNEKKNKELINENIKLKEENKILINNINKIEKQNNK